MQSQAKTAIVTGAASGIGRGLAEELAARGRDVVLADRQLGVAEEVAAAIRGRGGAATAVELDVRDAARFRAVVDTAVQRSGRLDYLFNNAGIGVGGETRGYDAADFDDVIDVNLRGVVHGIMAAYPRMIAQGSGHIVNTASMAGLVPGPLQGSYVATKHAVVGLSRALRIEAAQYGVRISVLCPGVIRTPILSGGRYGRFKPDLDAASLMAEAERLRPMAPADFARRTLDAVELNRAIIIYPWPWRLAWYLDRISPALSEKLWAFALRHVRARQAGRA